MKYPIGIQDFKKIRKDGFVYIDKTALLYKLVNEGSIFFLSRPRRFGKSLLVSTLKYYFSGEKSLFTGLAIDSLETKWEQYPIFHIDFNGSDFTVPHTLQRLIKGRVEDWEHEYGFQGNPDYSPGERFVRLLAHVHKQTGKRCVVLVDEYDKPLLDVLDTERKVKLDDEELLMEDYNRETLKGFYSAFKAADQDLRFVLLTGVTKFSQVSVFSGFNQPEDISMNAKYDAICGITKEELETVFHDEIDAMAEKLKVTAEEMRNMLQRHYDGYHFSDEMTDIFNPFSVLNALNSRSIQDYWFRTGTPTYLVRLLNHTNENLNDLTGNYYDTSEFVDYRADVERPLPMIYQSGYLTIKDWNMDTDSYLLDFPNDEVKSGFVTMVAANYLKPKESPDAWILEVVNTMKVGDCDKLEKLLTSFFASIPYSQRRKDDEREKERYFQYTFYLVIRMISCFTVLTEKEQSEGRVDCIVETPKFVYIFEFKRDGSASEALKQIEEKGYAREYAADNRTIYQIGCNFSSKTGTIDDWKSTNLHQQG